MSVNPMSFVLTTVYGQIHTIACTCRQWDFIVSGMQPCLRTVFFICLPNVCQVIFVYL